MAEIVAQGGERMTLRLAPGKFQPAHPLSADGTGSASGPADSRPVT
jgi:hypothetical protein